MEPSPTEAQWQQWLDEHAAKFWLFARQQARSDADAQDLMQEAILEAAQRAGPGQPPAPALVFATLSRRAIDWARRQDRRQARELAVADETGQVWFDSAPEERERTALIQATLQKLPAAYREVITLKLWGGLTFSEIGQALGISANTVASRYRYGLQELRKLTREVFT